MRPVVISHKKLYNIIAVLILFIVLMFELASCANLKDMEKNHIPGDNLEQDQAELIKAEDLRQLPAPGDNLEQHQAELIKAENHHQMPATGTNLEQDQPVLIRAEDLRQLPAPVASWLERSGVVGTPHIHRVWLSQESEMRMSPEKDKWNSACSEQVFDADDPAFTWWVKMKMGPFSIIRGKDVFAEGKGKMKIRLFSLIPVVNETGPKIDEGSIQRFLGEIAWFPQAALKPYIKWEQIDPHSAKAVIESHGTRGEGTFYFNSEGDFVRYTALRYKGSDADAERKEWVIDAKEHASFSGIRVPSRMVATWKLEEGDWTWLKMEVTDVVYNEF